MAAILSENSYGKSAVRVLKVKRGSSFHEVSEYTVNVKFEGDFETAHTFGDNSKILPTDTMKNTVYAIAKDDTSDSCENFASNLAQYFLKNNRQVNRVIIEISEKLWNRILIDEKQPHPHSFISAGNETRHAKIILTTEKKITESGMRNLVVLKTTESGFEKFLKDKFTTLKETNDRIFSTIIRADWKLGGAGSDFNDIYHSVRKIIVGTFAEHDSLSVQQTLFETGKNVINNIPSVSQISLSMPNKHYLLFNLEQFGMENNSEIFVPTDEPYGLIEAVVVRN